MFKPVSTFMYSEKKINLNLHLISKAQCLKENWREPSAVNLLNLGCPAYYLYGKTKIL